MFVTFKISTFRKIIFNFLKDVRENSFEEFLKRKNTYTFKDVCSFLNISPSFINNKLT